jgi:hypothetical protein
MRKKKICKYCKEEKLIAGLGLCGTCYTNLRRGNLYLENGELKKFKVDYLFKKELISNPEGFRETSGLSKAEADRYYNKFKHLIK